VTFMCNFTIHHSANNNANAISLDHSGNMWHAIPNTDIVSSILAVKMLMN